MLYCGLRQAVNKGRKRNDFLCDRRYDPYKTA